MLEEYLRLMALLGAGGAGACLAGFGCCVGSRVGERFGWGPAQPAVNRGNVLLSASRCEECGTRLGLACAPVVGWMVGCRSNGCLDRRREMKRPGRARGSPVWPLLEATGMLCGIAAIAQGWQSAILAAVVVPLACAAAASDLRWRMVPEILSVPLLVLCLWLSPFADAEARIWGVAALAMASLLMILVDPREIWHGLRAWRRAWRERRRFRRQAREERRAREAEPDSGGNGAEEDGQGADAGDAAAEESGGGAAESESEGAPVGEKGEPGYRWLRAEVGIGGADCLMVAALGALGGIGAGVVMSVVCLAAFVAAMAGAGRAGRGSGGEPLVPWLAAGMMLMWLWGATGWPGFAAADGLGQVTGLVARFGLLGVG